MRRSSRQVWTQPEKFRKKFMGAWVDLSVIAELDKMVRNNEFPSRSHAVRYLLSVWMLEHTKRS